MRPVQRLHSAPRMRFAFVLLLAAACTDTNTSGSYTLMVQNAGNSCGLLGWVDGVTTTNVPFDVVDDDSHVTATLGGSPGNFVSLTLGDSRFTGSSQDNRLEVGIHGAHTYLAGVCPFTIDATTLIGVSPGQGLSGEIIYTRVPSLGGCEWLAGCQSVQGGSGTAN